MVLITDEKGHICEINPSVTEVLGMTTEFVEQNSRYISDALKIDQVFDFEMDEFD